MLCSKDGDSSSLFCVALILTQIINCIYCFDSVGWVAGKASGLYVKTEWWGAGMVVCLE